MGPQWVTEFAPDGAGRTRDMTLAMLMARSLRENHSRRAVVDEKESYTYAQLAEHAQALVDLLTAQGLRPGDRVAFVGANSARMILADVAIVLGGFARVGLSPRLSPDEVVTILDGALAGAVLADEVWVRHLRARTEAGEVRALLVDMDAGSEGPQPQIMADGLADHARQEMCEAARARTGEVATNWLSYLFYTSGTTGTPKGAVVTQESMVSVVQQINLALPDIDGRESILHVAPIAHFSGVAMLTSLIRGGEQRTMTRFDPDTVLDAIGTHGVSIIPMVPTMVSDIVAAQRKNPRDITALRCIFYVGSAIAPAKLHEAISVMKCGFVQSYALTEAPLALTVLTKSDHTAALAGHDDEVLLASAGRALPGVDIAISDGHGGRAEVGEPGEILVRSPTMMQCYWRNSAETEAVFDAEGWLHTGDVGHLSSQGYLFITDRIKEMIVTGGFNVYPAEVERVAQELDWVAECVVVGLPDEHWGEAIAIFIVVDRSLTGESEEALAAQVIAHCKRRLAGYKAPKRVEFRSELPKNANGKLLRRGIRDEFWQDRKRKV